MEEKLSGIVLSSISYGENDKILTVFTLEQGTLTARIKGVKKAGAKLKFAAEPFCFAEFIFSVKGNMRTVINASLIDSFYPVRENLFKYFTAGTVVEYVRKFAKENIISSELFFLTVNSLKEIAYGNGLPQTVAVGFLLTALKLSGYQLNISGCRKCGQIPTGRVFFDYVFGGFLCEDCFNGEGREINLSTFTALNDIANGKEISSGLAVKCLKLLDFYLSAKTDEKINSLKELLKISN